MRGKLRCSYRELQFQTIVHLLEISLFDESRTPTVQLVSLTTIVFFLLEILEPPIFRNFKISWVDIIEVI